MAAEDVSVSGETTVEKQPEPPVQRAEDHSKSQFSVKILKIIKDQQQQHGLRHGDYQRYRSYCSRRLRRLRKTLGFVQGDRKHYKKKVVTEDSLKDERHLYIPLVMSERSWSHGMQLKQEANSEPRKKFHLVSRLRKATKYAEQLEKLCENNKCDARTKLEGQAYSAWIRGSLQFQLELWKPAMESFHKAQTIYEKLASVVNEDEQPLYHQRVDELAPSLRYCAYNIGDESARQDLLKMRGQGAGGDVFDNLDVLIAQTREKQSTSLSEVSWKNRTVPVTHEKVRTFLLAIQEFDNELARAADGAARLAAYEALLLDAKDAIQAVRDEMQNDPSAKPRTDGSLSSKQYLLAYLTFLKLTKTIERYIIMIENLANGLPKPDGVGGKKPAKPQDFIRLYDVVLHNISELKQVPSLEDDSDFQHGLDAQTSAYKAFRCYYMALSFTNDYRWNEALAVYQRSAEHCNSALKGQLEKPLEAAVNKLLTDIEGQKFSAHAHSILMEEGDGSVKKAAAAKAVKKMPLVDRLDEYYEDPALLTNQPNVANFPPDFEPVGCKPLFFDLAFNHIKFPSLDEKEQKKQSAGLTGFVKGFLGWGGSGGAAKK